MAVIRVSGGSGSVVVSGGGRGGRDVPGVCIQNGNGNTAIVTGPRLPLALRRRVAAWARKRGIAFDDALAMLTEKGLAAEEDGT